MRSLSLLILGIAAVLATGCASAVSAGHNTALDSVDLTSMTDQMARSMAGEPRVRQAIARDGKLTVVVQPVDNQLTGEVLPEGQREMFIVRLRTLLSKSAPNSFTWIMNRGTYYRLRQKELDLGPAPDRIQPEYALTAKFLSLTDESSQRRTAAYLCVYELTNIKTGALLWTDKYEVKKTAVKGMLD